MSRDKLWPTYKTHLKIYRLDAYECRYGPHRVRVTVSLLESGSFIADGLGQDDEEAEAEARRWADKDFQQKRGPPAG